MERPSSHSPLGTRAEQWDSAAPKGDSPAERYPATLAEDWRILQLLYDDHIPTVKGFMLAGEGAMFRLDLFLSGVLQRSLHLVRGFLSTFSDWNIVCAAPLVRLQIDNLVRVSYVSRHPLSDEVAGEALGTDFRHMVDERGKKLYDHQLVQQANRHHPWVKKVYEASSGWIHLSPTLLTIPHELQAKSPHEARVNMEIKHVHDDKYPEKFLAEILGSMCHCTSELLAYAGMWEYKKQHPQHLTSKPPV